MAAIARAALKDPPIRVSSFPVCVAAYIHPCIRLFKPLSTNKVRFLGSVQTASSKTCPKEIPESAEAGSIPPNRSGLKKERDLLSDQGKQRITLDAAKATSNLGAEALASRGSQHGRKYECDQLADLQGSVDKILQQALVTFEEDLITVVDRQLARFQDRLNEVTGFAKSGPYSSKIHHVSDHF